MGTIEKGLTDGFRGKRQLFFDINRIQKICQLTISFEETNKNCPPFIRKSGTYR